MTIVRALPLDTLVSSEGHLFDPVHLTDDVDRAACCSKLDSLLDLPSERGLAPAFGGVDSDHEIARLRREGARDCANRNRGCLASLSSAERESTREAHR